MLSVESIWPLVLWLLGILCAWLIISVAAFAILSVWQQLHAAFALFLANCSALVATVSKRLQATVHGTRAELLGRLRWYEVDQLARRSWLETVANLIERSKTNAAELEHARAIAAQAVTTFNPITRRLMKLRLISQSIPEMPDLDAATHSTRAARVALTNFIIATLLLPPILATNALMTGLVLKEVIPPVQPLFGISVPYVIAAVLVLIEATLGLLHSAEAEGRRDTERWITPAAVLWTTAGIGVVTTEALLYGVVDPGEVLQLPIAGTAFGLIGALLGLAVFGLGRFWHHSLVSFLRERTPAAVRKELYRLKHAAEEWNAIAEGLRPNQEAAHAALTELETLARTGSEVQTHELRGLLGTLERHRLVLPPWAKASERPLNESEFHERESRSYFWSGVAIVAFTAIGILGATLAVRVASNAGFAVGLGVAIASFALGALVAQLMPRESSRRMWAIALMMSGPLFVSIVGARFLRGDVTFHSLILFIPGIAAYAAGIQLGADTSLLRLPTFFVWRSVVMSALFGGLTLGWVVRLLLALVEFALRIAAWPTIVVVGAFRRPPQVPPGIAHGTAGARV